MGKKTKTAIIVLAVLLGLSLTALGGIIIYKTAVADKPATVAVPDNLITDKKDFAEADAERNDSTEENTGRNNTPEAGKELITYTAPPAEVFQAANIELFAANDSENKAFEVSNMFPGDEVTKYFRVKVKYKNQATVRFIATVRSGGEKLAEALKIKVVLLSTNETLYDGAIKDIPENITHTLSGGENELYFSVTGYLDTSAGNEYQGKKLVADFEWRVLEKENLQPEITGDMLNTGAIVLLVCAVGLLLALLSLVRRCREDENG